MNYEIVELEKEIPLSDFTANCVDIPRFARCCAECSGYGKTWACPPYDFDRESVWADYNSIILRAKKIVIPEPERKVDDVRSAYLEIFKVLKRELLEGLFEMERDNPGSLALSAGGCDFCEECTRPYGKPCRLPEKKRCSIESLGGDVTRCLERYFGETVLWAENGMLPKHLVIVGGLLKK